MEDKLRAVVTGTSGTLGAAVARRLGERGYEVIGAEGASLPAGYSGADLLVLAHGIAEEPNWMDCSADEWRRLRVAGLDFMFTSVQAYANARIHTGAQGVAIIVTSDASHAEDGSDVLRSTISWGVRGLVRNASTTYARKGVRVNGICVDGDAAEDVAALAEFLAEGEHITGQTIPVAGGRALL